MNYSYNEILFLDLDKAKTVCKTCRMQNLNKREVENKRKILDRIFNGKIELFIVKQTKPSYNTCLCPLIHFDKPCMSVCLSNNRDFTKDIADCSLWRIFSNKA